MSNRGVCKASAHSSGGSSHVEYMTREAAHGKDKEGRRDTWRERVAEHDQMAGPEEQDHNLIWTWNTPYFVTGDRYGADEGKEVGDDEREGDRGGRRHKGLDKGLDSTGVRTRSSADQVEREHGAVNQITGEHITGMKFEEKQANALAYFGGQLDYEESLGGTSHYRIVVAVSRKVATVEGLKLAANAFLRDGFPNNPALICIHADTDNLHAHILVLSRQLDGTRVNLKNDYFRLDEKWAKAAAEHFKEPAIYVEHFKAKQTTLAWKRLAKKAREEGRPIPPKPDRHRDHWEVWNSDKPWNDFWCGRVASALKTHEKKLEYQTLIKAKPEELEQTKNEIKILREKYDSAGKLRRNAPDRKGRKPGEAGFNRSKDKQMMPPEIPTVMEREQAKEYNRVIRLVRVQQREERTLQLQEPLRETATQYLKGLKGESLISIYKNRNILELHTGWMIGLLLQTFKEQDTSLDQTTYSKEGLTEYCRILLSENSEHFHHYFQDEQEQQRATMELRQHNTERLLPHLNQALSQHLKEIGRNDFLIALKDEHRRVELLAILVGKISVSINEHSLTLEQTNFTAESLHKWTDDQVTRIGTELERIIDQNLTIDHQNRAGETIPSYGTFEKWNDPEHSFDPSDR